MTKNNIILSLSLAGAALAFGWRAVRQAQIDAFELAQAPQASSAPKSLGESEAQSSATDAIERGVPASTAPLALGSPSSAETPNLVATAPGQPRLLELGSDSCVSCRAMIPVLAELRTAHSGQLQVDFIDVWKYPKQAEPFGIRVIPTQIFLGADGEELFRHEGFFSAEKIREQWSKSGYSLSLTSESL